MKVFLDTNVLVSAFATRGLCADVLRQVLAEHELLVGERVLREVRRVLRVKLRVSQPAVDEIEQFLRTQTVVAATGTQGIGESSGCRRCEDLGRSRSRRCRCPGDWGP